MLTTRRFWSLSPSPAPALVVRPRLAPSDGPEPTRRWFLGALGLVVAQPSVLVPRGASRVDVIDPLDWYRVDVMALELERVTPFVSRFYERADARPLAHYIPMRRGGSR